MRNHHYIDFEFNGKDGDVISFSILRNDGKPLYIVFTDTLLVFEKDSANFTVKPEIDPWVNEHVIPKLFMGAAPYLLTKAEARRMLEEYFADEPSPHIIADYPDDIKYFCDLLVTGPGTCINVPHMTFEWLRIDAYPTTLEGAIQHNAWWDTQALRHAIGHHKPGVQL